MENNLVPLSEFGLEQNSLSKDDMVALQLKLCNLLTRRTRIYTMGDSSSVRVETAQELLASICFLLRLHFKENRSSSQKLLGSDAEEILANAIKTVECKIELSKKLYKTAYLSIPEIENISLVDTLNGIGTFFKQYDYRFFAHQIPCDIDYQLCISIPETEMGIEYISQYLSRLIIENEFLQHFQTDSTMNLLSVYCPNFRSLLINLYEPVMANAIGLAMIDGDIYKLNITDAECAIILNIFNKATRKDAEDLLRISAKSLCNKLQIRSAAAKGYLTQAAVNLYPRIEAALTVHNLGGIFLSW